MTLPYKITFDAIGTTWQIDTLKRLPDDLTRELQVRIDQFDKNYSRFRDDSLVTAISHQAGSYQLPSDAAPLLAFYQTLYKLTDGKVTPLIGVALERAGYDAAYSLKSRPQRPIPLWEGTLDWDSSSLTTHAPALLDFGAAGKGYLVDILAALLHAHGVSDYVIDASGDLRHSGKSENRVGLEHPLNPRTIIGVINVQNQSLCASASNRRRWGKDMRHIFDPTSRSPVRDVIATWVIADSAMVADGIATALFLTEPRILLDVYSFKYVRMFADQSIDYSQSLEGGLFP